MPFKYDTMDVAGGGAGKGSLLDGLRSKPDLTKPYQKSGYMMTLDQAREAREGGTPSGFVRDEQGRLKPLVQGGN